MKPQGLIVFAYSEKFEEMRRFYEQALGVTGKAGGPNWVEFQLGTSSLALHRQPEERQDPRTYNLDVVVGDIAAAVEQFGTAGAQIVRGIQDEAFGKSAVLRDPEGRIITLVEEG